MAVQSTSELVQKKCKPCEGGVEPYSPTEAQQQLKQLQEKIEEMEKKYDYQFTIIFDAVKKLLDPPDKSKRSIGFHVK